MLSNGWGYQKQVSAAEGLIAIGYERKHAQYSRLHQYAKLVMYAPSSGLFSCPLAMTDGRTPAPSVCLRCCAVRGRDSKS
jgi:hypothetical protein